MIPIKIFLLTVLILLPAVVFINITFGNNSDLTSGANSIILGFDCFILLSLWVLQWKSSLYDLLPQMLMFFDLIWLFEIWMIAENLVVYEYVFPAFGFIFLLAVISPIKWKANCTIVLIWMIYFGLRLHQRDGQVTATFVGSMAGTFFYFLITSVSLNRKVKDLYAAIEKSERLIGEQKRILTLFPDAVLIQSRTAEGGAKTMFSNNEFDAQIAKVRHRASELDGLKVSYSKSEIEDSGFVESTLEKLLDSHQRQLDDSETVQQQKVTIWCREFSWVGRMLDENSEVIAQKIF